MRLIPLLVPHMPSADDVMPYLRRIDHNRKYTNFGPLNEELERLIGEAVPCSTGDAPHVTTVSNCTVGIELALQAWGIKPGDRVLVPAITFVATATAVLRIGATPIFADIDPENWLLTPTIAERALLEGRIDAVVPVSTFGCVQPVAAWDAFTSCHGIPVIVDAAGAFGNQDVGRTTDVVFSFHATKSFGAGEGGAVLSVDPSRIAEIRRLSNFGIDTSIAMLTGIGTNGKMCEYQCAVGLASFDMWEETRRRRTELHARYKEKIARIPGVELQDKPDHGIYPLFPVLLPHGACAVTAIETFREAGIETRRWYCPPLYQHPALSGSSHMADMTVAEDIGKRIIGLPFFLGMSEQDIERVANALRSILGSEA